MKSPTRRKACESTPKKISNNNNKSPESFQLVMLFLVSSLSIGTLSIQDMPAVLQPALTESLNFTTTELANCFSIMNLPNILLAPFAVVYITQLGKKSSLIHIISVFLFGHGIFIYGLTFQNKLCIYAGRFIYGSGIELFNV